MKYFLLLNFLIGFLFFGCTQKESLKDDFFDFEKIKTIKTLGNFSVKIPGNINIVFDSIHGDLTDKIQWDRVNDNFNLDGTYMMSNNKEFFYFKIGGQTIRNNKTIFTRINWLNNSIPTHGKYNFRLINVPFIQYGSVTVCTIGDSQTRYGEATALRSEINKLFSKAIFVGNRQDIYGYPHEGEGGNNTKKLLERTDFIPKADYYTLLIGTNNWGVKKFDKQLKRAFLDIKNIINEIKKIAPKSKILYITPMPTIKKQEMTIT